jgi:hypothetical protein
MHLESTVFLSLSKDSMKQRSKTRYRFAINLLAGGNPPGAKPLAVLAALDISASVIASAPLPHSRWLINPPLLKSGIWGKVFDVWWMG